MPGCVIEQQQDPPARQEVTPQCRPGFQAGRDVLRGYPSGQQQAGQSIRGVDRPLPGGVGVQRQENCPSGKPAASRCAACTANVVLPIPAIPPIAWIPTTTASAAPVTAPVSCASSARGR